MDDDLIRQVRARRADGCSPKEIARGLGVSPAAVASVVQAIAAEGAAYPPERRVLGCWVSPGWSEGLRVHGHPEWPGQTRRCRTGEVTGLVAVLVARPGRRCDKVSVCGYLVDTYCLGVKDTFGPTSMSTSGLETFRSRFFRPYGSSGLAAPVELAQQLVFGAVEYARRLGLEPYRDFASVAGHLGAPPQAHTIEFGNEGQPYYVQGPHDDAGRILAALESCVGAGNFHFLVRADQIDSLAAS